MSLEGMRRALADTLVTRGYLERAVDAELLGRVGEAAVRAARLTLAALIDIGRLEEESPS